MNSAKTAKPKTIYLKDYKPSHFHIEAVYLDFALFDNHTIVSAKIVFEKTDKRVKNLRLSGEHLELLALSVDGKRYDDYELLHDGLLVKQVPERFVLSTQVNIHPQKNTLLSGLYRTSMFCTQCEAEGFRRITYFLDRPDVMTEYRVRIEADKRKYPVLLSNGNLLEAGDLNNGRHYCCWHDPFAKPAYLFALVAGNLAVVEKNFTTMSGRQVLLQIFTERAFIHQADYALEALERSMRWDEQVFGLEYDLNRYMIVAISDFNMGAMENKGLNVFNSRYVLATPATATDSDFLNIENVIGHEYFHNWTGNRVTCRDWFQLSLKEGLTVFRDASFSADMTTKGLKRLQEVRSVREHQFIEDQGPMSHPVRPDNYIEINNFYTLTIYEKGAEVIRMMYNLIGEANFKKGMALYFARHDGQAVTVEDFAKAMSDASGTDLMGQFFRWYTQAGTPELTVATQYDAASQIFKVCVKQYTPPTPGQGDKQPVVIPIAYRLYDEAGKAMSSENILVLDGAEKTVEFGSISSRPILSFLRNFSAPVKVICEQSEDDLYTLLRYDDDLFVRFDAVQSLLKRLVRQQLQDDQAALVTGVKALADTLMIVMKSDTPAAEKAILLTLPELSVFFDVMVPVDVDRLQKAVLSVKDVLAGLLSDALCAILSAPAQYSGDDLHFQAMAERSYRHACLILLAHVDNAHILPFVKSLLADGEVMTNRLAALSALNQRPSKVRSEAFEAFYQRFENDPQVTDKWLSLQAQADFDETIDMVKALAKHPAFSLKNPNKVRALYGSFCMRNVAQFHHISGRGYDLLVGVVSQLDALNPSMAARMVTPLTQWRRFDSKRQSLMQARLQQLLDKPPISKDLYEVVSKSLVS